MDSKTIYLPVNLPGPIYRFLKVIRDRFSKHFHNLLGDRDIEWSFVAAYMPQGPGTALDFGPGGSYLALMAGRKGFKVTALDREVQTPFYVHPGLEFAQGDILQYSLPPNSFDLILNCSTVEHVGLVGRYGITEDNSDGDIKAMQVLRNWMKPGAVMLLTIPVGRDRVFAPYCRVYGETRLRSLLKGFRIEKEEYWVKDSLNRWILVPRDQALKSEASIGSKTLRNIYALGCFVLRKED
ncbi:MAG: DUF268 domain-containing protein [Candidatus Omnitrophica bacterium]|nr:DUF268 domain-containing protein [Candidatus Omnitrophota bacterium]